MGFSLMDQYQHGPCKAFDYVRFWSHSLLMAVAMQALAALGRVGSPDELFACGLMARIGCLALATVYPLAYAEILEQCDGEAQLAALEREHLHANHNDFTAAILCDCGIPSVLVESVYYHEAPATSGFTEGSRPYQLVHLFYNAKRLADMGLAPETERNSMVSELMLLAGKLGLDTNDLGCLVDLPAAASHPGGHGGALGAGDGRGGIRPPRGTGATARHPPGRHRAAAGGTGPAS
jgi:hypothetical protein